MPPSYQSKLKPISKPSYAAKLKPIAPQQPVTPPKKNFLQKAEGVVTSVFPGKQVGKSIGTLGGLALEKIKGVFGGKDNSKFYDTSAPTPLQTAGDVANIGLTVAGFKGAGMAGKLLPRVAKTAALGAGLSGSNAVSKGDSVQDVGKSAAIGGAVGGAIPLVGAGLGAIGNALTKKAPKQLVNYALRVPATKASKKVNEAILERGYGGKPLGTILDQSKAEERALEKSIQSRLTDKVLTGTDDFADDLSKSIGRKTGATINASAVKERVAKFVPDHAALVLKKDLTEKEANVLRRAIDTNLKEATFQGKELTNEHKVIKEFADSLRNLVKSKTGTGDLFKRQSQSIGINKAVQTAIDKHEVLGRPGLLDATAVGLGLLSGAGTPGVITAVAAERIVRNPRFQMFLAQALRNSSALGPILKQLAPAERTVLLDLVAKAKNPSN